MEIKEVEDLFGVKISFWNEKHSSAWSTGRQVWMGNKWDKGSSKWWADLFHEIGHVMEHHITFLIEHHTIDGMRKIILQEHRAWSFAFDSIERFVPEVNVDEVLEEADRCLQTYYSHLAEMIKKGGNCDLW